MLFGHLSGIAITAACYRHLPLVTTEMERKICITSKISYTLPAKNMEYLESTMVLLPDTLNRGLHMRRDCRERFPPPPTSRETPS